MALFCTELQTRAVRWKECTLFSEKFWSVNNFAASWVLQLIECKEWNCSESANAWAMDSKTHSALNKRSMLQSFMRAITESRTGIHDKARLPGGRNVYRNAKRRKKKKSKKGLCNSTISPIYCLNPFISCTAAQKDITMYFRPFLQIFVAKNLAGAFFMGY